MAITSLATPECINDVQRLGGRIAALSRFISRLGEKAIPLYQLLRKTDNFVWSDAANEAFEESRSWLIRRFLLLRLTKSHCCYMWQLTPGLLVWLLWWSARRPERNIRFNAWFITSARCSLSQNRDIHIGISLFTGCSWQAGSLSITFRVILSLWLALLL